MSIWDELYAKKLNSYVEDKIVNNEKISSILWWNTKCYRVGKVVNSFKAEYADKASIFITGSNSDLLSGELPPNIVGRYVSFKIYPFTFDEVCKLKGITVNDKYAIYKK